MFGNLKKHLNLNLNLSLAIFIVGLSVSTLKAATITVNSYSGGVIDDKFCALRAAIESANTDSAIGGCSAGNGADLIAFSFTSSNRQITLTEQDNFWYGPNALPPIYGELVIDGGSAGVILKRADEAPPFRFFYIAGYLHLVPETASEISLGRLSLKNITLDGGLAAGESAAGGGGAGLGGAIYNQGVLNLEQTLVVNNQARGGDGGAGGSGGGMLANMNGYGGQGGAAGSDGASPGSNGFNFYEPAMDGGAGDFGLEGAAASFGGGGASGGNGRAGGQGGIGRFGNHGTDHDDCPPFGSIGGGDGQPGIRGGDGGLGGDGGDAAYAGFGGGAAPGGRGGAGGKGGKGGDGGSGGSGCGGGGSGDDAPGGDGGDGANSGSPGYVGLPGFGGGEAQDDAIMNLGAPGEPPNPGNPITFPGLGGLGGGITALQLSGGGAGMGGALFNHFGSVTIANTTFTQNTATGGSGYGAGSGFGGAVFNLNGQVRIESSTLAFNDSIAGIGQSIPGRADGGSIFNHFQDQGVGNEIMNIHPMQTTVLLDDSIIAVSMSSSNDCYDNNSGWVLLVDNNLIQQNALAQNECGSGAINNDPMLLPLSENGGSTWTMALDPLSPVIGIATDCPSSGLDQRGMARQAPCDLGAFELGDDLIFRNGF